MSKISIKKIYIKDGDKNEDIKGLSCNLDTNFNLICGNNEIGKSSIAKFIKYGLYGYNISSKEHKNNFPQGQISLLVDDKEKDFNVKKKNISNINDKNDKFEFANNYINYDIFKTAFSIDLKDLDEASDAYKKDSVLLRAISGMSVKSIEEELKLADENFSLFVNKNGTMSKKFQELYQKRLEINNFLNSASYKEDEYIRATNDYTNQLKIIKNLKEKKEIINQKLLIKNKKEELKELENKFNYKPDNDKNIETINKIKKYIELKNQNTKLNEEKLLYIKDFEDNLLYFEKYNLFLNKEFFENFKLNHENKTLINELNLNLTALEANFAQYNEQFSNQTEDKKEIKENLLKYSNLESYSKEEVEKDKIFVEKTLELYTQNLEQLNYLRLSTRNKIKKCVLILFNMILLATSIYFYKISPIFALITGFVSIVYFMITIFDNLHNEKKEIINLEIKNYLNEINELSKKYINEPFKKNGIVQAQFAQILHKINELLTNFQEYENLQTMLTKINKQLDDSTIKINNHKILIEKNKNEISDILKSEFPNNSLDIKIYSDIIEKVTQNKKIYEKISYLNQTIDDNSKLLDKLNLEICNYFSKINLEFLLTNDIDNDLLFNFHQIIKDNMEIQTKKEEIISNLKNLEDYDKLEIREEISQESILKTENEIDKANNILGQYQNKVATLEELTKNIENKRIELNSIDDSAKNIIKKLLTDKIIHNIIEESKKQFFGAQPNLRFAIDFLKILTNNKYTKIYYNEESHTFSIGNESELKETSILSRGTLEALYLSLRLGYAKNYSLDNNCSLPLILDDILVNFDKNRTIQSLKCFEEFSKTNQVIFFTCHKETMEKLCTANNIKANFINLS